MEERKRANLRPVRLGDGYAAALSGRYQIENKIQAAVNYDLATGIRLTD